MIYIYSLLYGGDRFNGKLRGNVKIDYSTFPMRFFPGASESMVSELVACAGRDLPEDYLNFLRFSNGAIGGFARIYKIELSIQYNKSDLVKIDLPGFFVIGSDGAGEAYGYNFNLPVPEIVSIPFIGGEWKHAIYFGKSINEFLERVLFRDLNR